MAKVLRYDVEMLPDSGDPLLRLAAAGDVTRAIRGCFEHLLRTLVAYPAGSAVLAIRFIYSPGSHPAMRRSRLAIALTGSAPDEQVAENLRVLIDCSDLHAYYRLKAVDIPGKPPNSYHAACDISRVERAIQPLHSPECNPAIPPVYYVCRPFAPRFDNDYLQLDRILDRIGESVLIEIAVEPVDVSRERTLHTRDIARLQSINRTHDLDEEDDLLTSDPFEAATYVRSGTLSVIKPLRRRDPIADDILRERRKLHERLGDPHLHYHLRVFAQTPAVARLVASVVAESAFDEGAYLLWPADLTEECFEPMKAVVAHHQVYSSTTLHRILGPHAAAFKGFERLGHVATVDELLGAFTLPVAGRSQTRCMRKNTDPPHVEPEQLLILGHDD